MPTETPRVAITELAGSAAGNYSSVNDMFRRLEQVAALRIEDRDLATPPGSPSDGDAYIVAGSATGDWSGQEGNVAYYNADTWEFIAPVGGMQVFVQDEKATLFYSSVESEWFSPHLHWSTTETWTGGYGSNGTKLYRKCVFDAGLSDHSGGSANHTIAHGISNLDLSETIRIDSQVNNGSLSYVMPAIIGGNIIEQKINGTNVVLTYAINLVSYDYHGWIFYEKTA